MNLLALEFSTAQRSVAALSSNPDGVLRVGEAVETGSEVRPFALIDSALQQAGLEREQIETLVMGLGPGSYTGIRLAISIAQGWELARNVKLAGQGTMELIAEQARLEGLRGRVEAVIDAQRGELYLAGFELADNTWKAVSALRLASVDEALRRQMEGALLIGPEVGKWFSTGRVVWPRAAVLAQLSVRAKEFVPGEKLEPLYLRQTSFVKAPPPRSLPF